MSCPLPLVVGEFSSADDVILPKGVITDLHTSTEPLDYGP